MPLVDDVVTERTTAPSTVSHIRRAACSASRSAFACRPVPNQHADAERLEYDLLGGAS